MGNKMETTEWWEKEVLGKRRSESNFGRKACSNHRKTNQASKKQSVKDYR